MAFEDELPTTPGMEEYLAEIRERDRQEEVRSQEALEELDALGGQGSDAEVARRSMNPNPVLGSREYEAAVAELIASGASPERPGFQGTPGQMGGQRPELSLGDTGLQDPTVGFGQAGGFGIQQPGAPAQPAPAEEEPGIPSITDKDYTPSRKYKGRYRAEKESADIAAQQRADIARTQKGFHVSEARERLAVKQEAAKRDAAYLKERAQVDEAADKMAREGMAKRQAMLDDINNTKIDTDYFGKSDVGGKIGMVLMAALGGLVQRRGEQNQGVALIQKMIDRDIRVQQANLAKKKWAAGQQVGIYQDSLQIERDKGKAMDMAHARYWTVVGNKIDAIKSKYGDKAKAAGFDLLAIQAREKRDAALLKIKGQEQREGVAWYNAKTSRLAQESAEAKWRAELEFRKDATEKAAKAARRQSVEEAVQSGFKVTRGPQTELFSGPKYRHQVIGPDGKPVVGKDGKPVWGRPKAVTIGRVNPAHDKTLQRETHQNVLARTAVLQSLADFERAIREKTRVNPKWWQSADERALVQKHLNLAVRQMHSLSGAQTTDKEFLRWADGIITGPNKWYEFLKGSPLKALRSYKEGVYREHRNQIRAGMIDIDEHWFDNMEEFYNPTINRVSSKQVGPYAGVLKAIESGDPGEAEVAINKLLKGTEKSVLAGTQTEGMDRETTFDGVNQLIEAIDERVQQPAWQPPRGKMPTGLKGKGERAPGTDMTKRKAWQMKMGKTVALYKKRARLAGVAQGYRDSFKKPWAEHEGHSTWPEGYAPEWMNKKQRQEVEKAFISGQKNWSKIYRRTRETQKRAARRMRMRGRAI
tara:strand:- start:2526 stop:4970 length:2445 start_codon:yes stop_codon:yes gene_type:complete